MENGCQLKQTYQRITSWNLPWNIIGIIRRSSSRKLIKGLTLDVLCSEIVDAQPL